MVLQVWFVFFRASRATGARRRHWSSKEFQSFQLEQLLKVSIMELLGHLIYLCIYCNELEFLIYTTASIISGRDTHKVFKAFRSKND